MHTIHDINYSRALLSKGRPKGQVVVHNLEVYPLLHHTCVTTVSQGLKHICLWLTPTRTVVAMLIIRWSAVSMHY